MYKNILVPHAGTPAGDNALKHAIHIAKSSKAKIVILHVVEDAPQIPMGFALHASEINYIKKQLKEVTRETKELMNTVMQKRVKICQNNKIQSELKITVGLPADEIMKIVRTKKIDLIVMAKRRKLKGIKKLLALGSVSRKVLEHASCPVMITDT